MLAATSTSTTRRHQRRRRQRRRRQQSRPTEQVVGGRAHVIQPVECMWRGHMLLVLVLVVCVCGVKLVVVSVGERALWLVWWDGVGWDTGEIKRANWMSERAKRVSKVNAGFGWIGWFRLVLSSWHLATILGAVVVVVVVVVDDDDDC